MTQTFSFFDSALLTATIEATGQEFDYKGRKDELIDLYSQCYTTGSVELDGFTIKRNICTETYNSTYTVTYTA
jgi:hypothetical protein